MSESEQVARAERCVGGEAIAYALTPDGIEITTAWAAFTLRWVGDSAEIVSEELI